MNATETKTTSKVSLSTTLYARSCVYATLEDEIERLNGYIETLKEQENPEYPDTEEIQAQEEQVRIYTKFLNMVETA